MSKKRNNRKFRQVPPVSAPISVAVSASNRAPGAVVLAVLVLAVVLASNILCPRSYTFFAWDYASYFSPGAQMIWTAVCMAVALAIYRFRDRLMTSGRLLFAVGALLAVLTVLSFYFCISAYPTIAGDGEYGESTMRSTGRFHLKLGIFLADSVFKESLLSVWVSMEMWAGFAYVLVCGLLAWKMRAPALARLGLLMMALGNPMLLNCLGHYDSYGVPMFMQLLWWIWFCWCDRKTGRALGGAAAVGVVMTGLACWAHPVFALLAAAAAYYVALCMARGGFAGKITGVMGEKGMGGLLGWGFRLFTKPAAVFWLTPLFGAILAAVQLVYTPQYLVHPDVNEGKYPLVGEYLGWFLHQKLMGYLWVSLPAAVMFLWLCFAARPWRGTVKPLASAALLVMWASFLSFFTLLFEQGLNDELPCTLIGMMAMCAAVVLVLEWAPERKWWILALFGTLAIFLHVPKVLVYGSDRYVERLVAIYPYDRCPHNSKMSSYVHLGLILPMESEYARKARLEVFKQGMDSKLPYWSREEPPYCRDYTSLNALYFIAWAYEFGEIEQARPIVQHLVANADRAQGMLMDLLRNGTRFTDRWRNKAYRRIRDDVRSMAGEAYEQTRRPIYQDLIKFVDALDARDSAARPAKAGP